MPFCASLSRSRSELVFVHRDRPFLCRVVDNEANVSVTAWQLAPPPFLASFLPVVNHVVRASSHAVSRSRLAVPFFLSPVMQNPAGGLPHPGPPRPWFLSLS